MQKNNKTVNQQPKTIYVNATLSQLLTELNNDAQFKKLDNDSQFVMIRSIVRTILNLRLENSIKGRLEDKPTEYLMGLLD